MNILINGCSFTGGSEVVHDEFTSMITNNGQKTWASHFEEQDTVNNIAIGGNSNDKIFRTSVEELDKNFYDLVIIQWTAIHRKERYSDRIKNWVNFCQDGENLYGYHTDNYEHMNRDNPKMKSILKSYEKISEGLNYDVLYAKTLQDYRTDYFKNVLSLQNLLETKNIDYIFTSMSFENHLPNMKNNYTFDLEIALTDFEKSLFNQMDLTKWTKTPMTHMMNQNVVSQNDGHPNEKGHKLIYNHVQSELNKLYG